MTSHWPVGDVLSVWACGLRWGWGPPIPSNYTAVYSVWWCLLAVAAASTKRLRTGYLNPSSLGPTHLYIRNNKTCQTYILDWRQIHGASSIQTLRSYVKNSKQTCAYCHRNTWLRHTSLTKNEMCTWVYLVEDGASALQETFLNILPCESTGLQEHQLCRGRKNAHVQGQRKREREQQKAGWDGINHEKQAYRIIQTKGNKKRQGLEMQDNANLTSVTILLSKAWRLQEGHLSVCIQVFLVATQDNNNVGARQSPCICQPVG